MKAVLYTGGRKSWAEPIGHRPWALLPVGSRPLLSYWLELCVDLGIHEVSIVLGESAEYIERFCGNGEKWGLDIQYSFLGEEDSPINYLRRNPQRWSNGLLYIGGSIFPRRKEAFTKEKLNLLLNGCFTLQGEHCAFFVSNDSKAIQSFIETEKCNGDLNCVNPCNGSGDCQTPDACEMDFTTIDNLGFYYDLNMSMVGKEMARYLSSGYSSPDGAAIGYNVTTPPSVIFNPPFAIGNDCRIGALASIGEKTVISDHVLIDRQSDLSECIILSDTYIGRNLEIKGKIVSGARIIDPKAESWVDIEDPWLVAEARPHSFFNDIVRSIVGWQIALGFVVLQVIPFLILYNIIRMLGLGYFVKKNCIGTNGKELTISYFVAYDVVPSILLMIFYGAFLDRFPQLLSVLAGRLWLCGQSPKPVSNQNKKTQPYFPAVFTLSDAFSGADKQIDALYYVHTRSVGTDLEILKNALFSRLGEVDFIANVVGDPDM